MSKPGPGVRPHLTVSGGDAALDFYTKAFGGVEYHPRSRFPNDPRLLHGEIIINESVVYVNDDFPEHNGGKSRTPKALGGTPITLHQCVADVDAAVNQALAAGAKVIMPVDDQFWGDRYGIIEDPFGYHWSFSTPSKNRPVMDHT
ncbi:VOC family protein [soil metagenome]